MAGLVDRAFMRAFIERVLAVWNEHDTTDLPELVTEDAVWIDPMIGEPARGVEGVRRFMEASWRSMPDLHFEAAGSLCFAEDTPVVMAPWRMVGTHHGVFDPPGFAPTGRRIDIQGIDVYTFRGRQVAHYQAFYDNAALARQLGLLPASGSRAERLIVALQRLGARSRFLRRHDDCRHTAGAPHCSEHSPRRQRR
jgi:steroid delta-isomerase-like uncharacterized protein